MPTIKVTKSFRKRIIEINEQNMKYGRKFNIEDKVDILFQHISTFPYMFMACTINNGVSIHKAYIKPYNIFYSYDMSKDEIVVFQITHFREYYRF